MPTKIEYCDETWSPITGCDPDDGYQTAACDHCWARRMSKRLAGRFGYPADDPFKVTLHPDRLTQPLHWRKPRRIFVVSMGDLFHEDVPDEFICDVWLEMNRQPQHTFIVLTKRPERMCDWVRHSYGMAKYDPPPLPNVIGMVTAENQEQADKRIPWLLKTPFAVRGVSVEPMLGAVDLSPFLPPYDWDRFPDRGDGVTYPFEGPEWIICGCETGPGARPMDLDWARSLRDQCQAAGVPYFFKRDSDGNRTLDGVMWEQYPETAGQLVLA